MEVKNKILVFLIYFGKFPVWFSLWLESCGINNSIDWMVITDNKITTSYPPNVSFKICSFDMLKEKIQSKYEFKIALNHPYKLCDFRPAFGEIFSDILMEYDYWGYCDCDLLFGNICDFINDDILNSFEKILPNGHLSIFRNNKIVNQAYKIGHDELNYKKIFTNENSFAFDEWFVDEEKKGGINSLIQKSGLKLYDKKPYDDISIKFFSFRPIDIDKNIKNIVYLYEGNKLYRIYVRNNNLERKEILYVHFQKREIKGYKFHYSLSNVMVCPNFFQEKYLLNNADTLKNFAPEKGLRKEYILFWLKRKRKSMQNRISRWVNLT